MLAFLLLLTPFFQTCIALYGATGSSCATSCNSTGGGTYWPDLVCSSEDFASTTKGQTLQSCLECTIDSTYINSSYTDGNSDQFWTLFHLKYVQQYCLTSTTAPHIAGVNACTSTCSPLNGVLEQLWINSHPFVGQYDYCTANSSAYPNHAADCARCLQSREDSVIIGNFVDTMNQACSTRPLAAQGELIIPSRALFNTSTSSSSSSSTPSTSSSSRVSGTSTPTSTTATEASASNNTAQNSGSGSSHVSTGLSTGAAAGIGAGVAVLAIATIVGSALLFVRRRKSRRAGPQAPVAAELPSSSGYHNGHGTNYATQIQEKPGYEPKVHEAASDSQSRIVELPASNMR